MILLTAGSGTGILIGSAVAGFGLSSVFPITIALLSCLGSKAARAAGPMFALGGLGGAIVPWLVGFAAMHWGSLRVALVLPLIAVVLMTALHGWYGLGVEEPAWRHPSSPTRDRI